MQEQPRPHGVSIIANLYIIAGILGIIGITLSATIAIKAPSVSAVSLAESLYILVKVTDCGRLKDGHGLF